MTAGDVLNTTKLLVDEAILAIVSNRKRTAYTINQRYGEFWERVERVATQGGKRLRPYLTVIGYGENTQNVLPVAVAQELVHIAVLMHDDVIDQDFVRHGNPNMNGLYREQYGRYVGEEAVIHYANSAAILAGDVLLSEAYRALGSSSFSDEIKQKLYERLGTSIYEVVGGEFMDVEAAFVTDAEFDPMMIYRYKTASYSFTGPLLSGAYCAELDDATIATLEKFAVAAGIAYQLQDDLLGVFGDEQQTGKSTLSDLREGKQTMLAVLHRSHMNDTQASNFSSFGDDTADEDTLRRIQQDMQDSGAREKTEAIAWQYFDDAAAALQVLPASSRKDALQNLLEQLQERKH